LTLEEIEEDSPFAGTEVGRQSLYDKDDLDSFYEDNEGLFLDELREEYEQ